jgi:hypothetical protein
MTFCEGQSAAPRTGITARRWLGGTRRRVVTGLRAAEMTSHQENVNSRQRRKPRRASAWLPITSSTCECPA